MKILILSLVLPLFFSSASFAAPLRCDQTLQNEVIVEAPAKPSLWDRTKTYGREMRASKGLRLFVKDSVYNTENSKWQGFLTKTDLNPKATRFGRYFEAVAGFVPRTLGRVMTRERGYEFSPLDGTYNVLVRKPVEYLSGKIANRKLEPAFFFKMPAILAISMVAYMPVDAVYQDRLDAHVEYQVTSHATEYDQFIQNDFRYKDIKTALAKGQLTREESEQEAYLVTLAYDQYFKYRNNNDQAPTVESELKIIDHYLFVHLKDVVENGVKKVGIQEGYIVPDAAVGPLKDPQILELFGNNHQRYLKYQIIEEMVKQTELWTEIKESQRLGPLAERLMKDPFTLTLTALRDAGKITTGELQSSLQEDAYWQNKFQDWKTIGVTRLKNVDGHYINEALTLDDIRAEMLADLNKSAPAK